MSDEQKKLTAYHEAGHAMLNLALEHTDPLHKVSIIPRGPALGVTMMLPIEDRYGYGKKKVLDDLCVAMGGRVAEEMFLGDISSGASGDIKMATWYAKKMVCEWGMSDLLGPMTFGKKNEEIFLGREIQSHRDYSEATARMIDEEVVKIIRAAQKKAHEVLDGHEKLLHLIAEELIKHETIDDDDIKRILSGKKVIRHRNNGQQPVSKTKPITDIKNQQSRTVTKKPIPKREPRAKTPTSAIK